MTMATSRKILHLCGWSYERTTGRYDLFAEHDDRVLTALSNDEIWVVSGGVTATPILTVETGIIQTLVRYINNNGTEMDRISTLDSGTSIAVCSRTNHTIHIVDTFPNENDKDNQSRKLLFKHTLPLPTRGFVHKVACGDSHCLILCGASCFSYGTNTYGQLGIGTHSEYSTELQHVHLPHNIFVSDVATGNSFSALVTTQGRVYTFGSGAYYKLGHGDDEDRLAPTRVVELDEVGEFQPDGTMTGVKLIACGRWHTVVVAHGTNDVYGWGWNKFGNLGVNPTTNSSKASNSPHKEEIVSLPRRIEDLDGADLLGDCCAQEDGVGGQEVVKVTCGSRHTALLTAAGKVIVMGPLGPSPVEGIDPPSVQQYLANQNRKFGSMGPVELPTTNNNNVSGQKRHLNENDSVPEPIQQQDHRSGNNPKLSTPIAPAASLYTWHNSDYHARLLNIFHSDSNRILVDKSSDKNIIQRDYIVSDICSHSWALACVCEAKE